MKTKISTNVCVVLAVVFCFLCAEASAATLDYTTGLKVWVSSLNVDGSMNSTMTDGGVVDTWKNLASDATAGDATYSGTTNHSYFVETGMSGGPAVSFNNSGLDFDEFMSSDTCTIFAKAHITGGLGGEYPVFFDYGSPDDLQLVYGAKRARARDANSDAMQIDPTSNYFSTPEVGMMVISESGGAFTLEAGPAGSTTTATNALYDSSTWDGAGAGAKPPTLMHFPSDGNDNYTIGYLAEFLVYDHVVTGADRTAVLAYMNDPTFVPEPSAIVLLGMGLFGLLAYAWRKRK